VSCEGKKAAGYWLLVAGKYGYAERNIFEIAVSFWV
jgi:hypothetical protein